MSARSDAFWLQSWSKSTLETLYTYTSRHMQELVLQKIREFQENLLNAIEPATQSENLKNRTTRLAKFNYGVI